jgi:hypothetical protein
MPTKKVAKPRKPANASGLRSAAVQSRLVAALELEILALANERIEDLVDPDAVRTAIERSEDLVDHARIGELIVAASRRVGRELRSRNESPWELLDADLAKRVDALLDTDVALSPTAEALIARMMRQELIQDLFTNVIHTAIVSFNKRVNPIFGGLASAMLEDQIKGFIRFFIPMVLDQATSFVVADRNQELFSDFARSLVRELLDEPIPNLLELVSAGDKRDPDKLAQTLAASPRLRDLSRRFSLAVWDEVYGTSRRHKLGDIVRLQEHAGWLAEQLAPGVTAALERPHLGAFLASAFGDTPAAAPAKRKATKKSKATKAAAADPEADQRPR